MAEPRPSRSRRLALGTIVLVLPLAGPAFAAGAGPSHWNRGITNLTFDSGYVLPGGTVTVSFDYTIEHRGHGPVDCPWEVRLDGTPRTRDGDVLASGSNPHSGDDYVTYPVSAPVVLPPTTPLGTHRLKIVTGVDGWDTLAYAEVEVLVYNGALVSWLGYDGYKQDGVNPDWGYPVGSSTPTTFVFRVRYTDPTARTLVKANCIIRARACGKWVWWKAFRMTWESGTPDGTGAVYRCAVQLRPNQALSYRFRFETADGEVIGTPSEYHFGPLLTGRPHLCWEGTPGFEADGVDPDSGNRGASFSFAVMYLDSWGTKPTLHQVLVRRNGKLYAQVDMTEGYGGDPQLGLPYYATVRVRATGTYEYRFRFRDETNFANGEPSMWHAGPTITTTTSALLSSATAAPTRAGAQVTFSLSAAANVTATIVNVAGRPVATIAAGKPLEAGLQTLLWDRKAGTGLTAPAGLYLIRLTARDADGGQSTALATVSLR